MPYFIDSYYIPLVVAAVVQYTVKKMKETEKHKKEQEGE